MALIPALNSSQHLFFGRLTNNAASLPGWTITVHSLPSKGMANLLEMGCPHGMMFQQYILLECMLEEMDPKHFADVCFRRSVFDCVSSHMDTPIHWPSVTKTMGLPKLYGHYVVPNDPDTPHATSFWIGPTDEGSKALSPLKPLPPLKPWTAVITPMGYGENIYQTLKNLVPALQVKVPCPEVYSGDGCIEYIDLPDGQSNIGGVVQHLNDDHEWSREEIADWLETLDVDLTIKPTKKDESHAPDSSEIPQSVLDILNPPGGATGNFIG